MGVGTEPAPAHAKRSAPHKQEGLFPKERRISRRREKPVLERCFAGRGTENIGSPRIAIAFEPQRPAIVCIAITNDLAVHGDRGEIRFHFRETYGKTFRERRAGSSRDPL